MSGFASLAIRNQLMAKLGLPLSCNRPLIFVQVTFASHLSVVSDMASAQPLID
jgi:hypothetical protein